jgi:hypothetical protein
MKEIIRAAFVIARRDFTAIIYSKAFIFFLLGPFFRFWSESPLAVWVGRSPRKLHNPSSA